MTATKWAHLPNASRIDAIIASVQSDPAEWVFTYELAAYEATRSAVKAAVKAAYGATRSTTLALYAAYGAARDATLALIAYDDCGYLLDLSPEQVKTIALLGHNAAVLLYPAVKVMHKINGKQQVIMQVDAFA